MNSAWLRTYSKLLFAATLLLIAAGGLVTSTESGLSVPDWPLSYGSLFPPMIGGIRFEHTHRVIAGIVGILTLILTVMVLVKEKRGWVRGLGVAATLAVITQAILGGLTVIYLLPPAVSIAHACLAQTFFALLGSLALFFSRAWAKGEMVVSQSADVIKRLTLLTAAAVYFQLILGALVRHKTGLGIEIHILMGVLIVIHALLIHLKIASDEGVAKRFFLHSMILGTLIFFQLLLGLGAFITTLVMQRAVSPRVIEVIFTTAHQTTGAAILATSVLLTLRAHRFLRQKVGAG
ncbi:MAG TPA: COX15/CtaA family protein [Candidatus Omnitrophota bacterium]|nr:COX15/CtaA family protein [Candidatus Omnitrophota bacterium]